MKKPRRASRIQGLFLAFSLMALGGGESIAQQLQDCAKDGTCVEFTVRYYSSKKIELIDPVSKALITKGRCEIGKDCKPQGGNLVDLSTLTLSIGYNPHYCYRVCGVGWCVDRCPSH